MPPAVARKHGSADSVRSKSKNDVDARKTVFRPVLDNPLNVAWPPISAPIRKQLLDALLAFLTAPTTTDELPIADWRLQEHARRRGRVHGAGKGKGKRAAEGDVEEGRNGKKVKASASTKDLSTSDTTAPPFPSTSTATPPLTHVIKTRSANTYAIPDFVDKLPRPQPLPPPSLVRPKLLDFLSVGINEVTRALEARIRWGRWELGDPSAAPGGGRAAEKEKLASAALAPPPKAQGKKTRHRRRTKEAPSAISPLSGIYPTSSTTLSRPSYRFLTQPVPNPSAKLPPYLLPPTETNDFFRMLANDATLKTRTRTGKRKITLGRKEYAGTLLKDVIESDDPAGERAARLARDSRRPVAGSQDPPEGPTNKSYAEDSLAVGGTDKADAMDVVTDGGAGEQDEEPMDEEDDWLPVLDIIFVCKPDVNPPSLVAHLPTMTAAANGVEQALHEARSAATPAEANEMDDAASQRERPASQNVFLIPLDLGAERAIAAALALRRVASIGLSSSAPGAEPLLALIRKHIKPLQAPWLVPHLALPSTTLTAHLIPTHVKHLRTSAPLDPKSSNLAKKAATRVRKEERRGELYVAED